MRLLIPILQLQKLFFIHVGQKLHFHSEPVSFHDYLWAQAQAWLSIFAPKVPLELVDMDFKQNGRRSAHLNRVGGQSSVQSGDLAEWLALSNGVQD